MPFSQWLKIVKEKTSLRMTDAPRFKYPSAAQAVLGGGPARATPEQHFVRVLFIFDRIGVAPSDSAPNDAFSEVRGQMRIHAVDFWMRNPDYLADELLSLYEDNSTETWALAKAEEIFDDREPSIRRLPMAKWRFGAYERMDDTFAIMTSRGLLKHQPIAGPVSIREHVYWLLKDGHEVAEELLAADPVFSWYAQRANLVARIAGDRTGTALKARQYEQTEYENTNPSAMIASIEPRVKTRLDDLKQVRR